MQTSIPDAEVLAFIKSLGADPNDVRQVLITPETVTVTEYRRNESGSILVAGHEPATVTTDIRIDREP